MAIGAHLGAKMVQDGAKLANLVPRCAQDGQLGGQDGQLGALLEASWRPFLDLGRDLAKNDENKKNDESIALLKVFCYLAFRAQDPKKWARCLPKCFQVGHFEI